MATGQVYVCAVILLCLNLSLCVPIDSVNSETGILTQNNLNSKYLEEIAVLKNEIVALQDRVTKLEVKSERGEKAYDTKDSPVIHLLKKRALRRRLRRKVPEVAFQASLTIERLTVKLDDAIIFNDVITNIGRAYNNHNGIFIAPFAGTYMFNTNIVSEKGHYVEASIDVNKKATVSAISDHRTSSKIDIWDQGNAVAILRLRKGDKVRVSVQWPEGSHDIHGVGKSSFSGYLLRTHGPL